MLKRKRARTPGAFLGGLRVVAVDRTVFDAPDTEANARRFTKCQKIYKRYFLGQCGCSKPELEFIVYKENAENP